MLIVLFVPLALKFAEHHHHQSQILLINPDEPTRSLTFFFNLFFIPEELNSQGGVILRDLANARPWSQVSVSCRPSSLPVSALDFNALILQLPHCSFIVIDFLPDQKFALSR